MHAPLRPRLLTAALLTAGSLALAQLPDFGPPPGFGGRGPGGPGGFGPGQHTKILDQFDKDGKGYLNAAERKAAREYLASRPTGGRGFGGRGGRGRGPGGPGFGPPGFGGESAVTPKPGPKVKPEDVKRYSSEKRAERGGGWRHTKVVLSPSNPEYAPITISEAEAEHVQIVAEFVTVVRGVI